MRQIVNTTDGGPAVLQIRDAPDPEPDREEVIIDVRAAGLNFADIQARKGQYPLAPDKPCVVGYEVAGVVKSVGSSSHSPWIDKEVIALTHFEGQSEEVAVPVDQVFEKPDGLSFAEAAAVPINYLAAHVLIVVMGSLGRAESILIHNAGGGVGIAALDLASHIGATTYGTASKHKHPFLKERGLDVAIDYRNHDWYEQLMTATDGKGVELILDPLGGKEWKRSYNALRPTGRLGVFGLSSASQGTASTLKAKWNLLTTIAQMPFFHPFQMLNKMRGVFGVGLGRHLWDQMEKARSWMEEVLEGVEEGWLHPHVDTTFSYEHIADAHRYVEERKNVGKVILTPRANV